MQSATSSRSMHAASVPSTRRSQRSSASRLPVVTRAVVAERHPPAVSEAGGNKSEDKTRVGINGMDME